MSVSINPAATGTPAVASQILSQSAIPFILPSRATYGNNGALTLSDALPNTFPAAWFVVPANAIGTGIAAGAYYCSFSSTTAGTLYNVPLALGTPNIPSNPTAFSGTTGAGLVNTSTASDLFMFGLSLPGGTMGPNGALRVRAAWTFLNTGTNSCSMWLSSSNAIGGSRWKGVANSSSAVVPFDFWVRNRGVQNSQVVNNQGVGTEGAGQAAVQYFTQDTSQQQYIVFGSFMGVNGPAHNILEGYTIEVVQL